MPEKGSNTTHDMAMVFEKFAKLLRAFPENEIKDLKQFAGFLDTLSENITAGGLPLPELTKETKGTKEARTTGETKEAKKAVPAPGRVAPSDLQWKGDSELESMSREELKDYFMDRKHFPNKDHIHSFAVSLGLRVAKSKKKDLLIDTIINHYERSRMFKTMSGAGEKI